MSRSFQIFKHAARTWQADNVFQHAAAVSFYTLFSLAPITIIAVTIAGFFFGQERAGRQLELQLTQLVGPASAHMITETAKASRTEKESWWATWIGIGLIVIGATTVFGQLQLSLNDIFGVKTHPNRSGLMVLVLRRLISFAMVLTIGFLLLVSLVLTTVITSALQEFSGTLLDSQVSVKVADVTVGLIVISVLFALLFKVMPDVHLQWREVWLGAVLTAGLFTIGRYGIALYLGHSTVASIYGSAGSLVALLIWIYYSCAILFFGVEFIRAYRTIHEMPVQPKKKAMLVGKETGSGPPSRRHGP